MNEGVVVYCIAVRDPHRRGWLKAYDVEAHDGVGDILLSPKRTEAIVFRDARAALLAWHSVPLCRPWRDDGKPNKPLTAYTVELMLESEPSVVEQMK